MYLKGTLILNLVSSTFGIDFKCLNSVFMKTSNKLSAAISENFQLSQFTFT